MKKQKLFFEYRREATIMKIVVDAKPGAKKESVEKIDDAHYVISVKEPPQKGRANDAVCHALAEDLRIAPSRIEIVSGKTSRRKILEIK